MREPAQGIRRRHRSQGLRDDPVERLPRPRFGFPQERVDFPPARLDRRQIGRVGRQIQPRRARACWMPGALWAARLSMTTISPGVSVGARMCFTYARHTSVAVAPSTVITAWIPSTPRVPSLVTLGP